MIAEFLEAYFPFPAPFERVAEGRRVRRPEAADAPGEPSQVPGARRSVVYDQALRPDRQDRADPQPQDEALF